VFHANVQIKIRSILSLYRIGRFDFPSWSIQCSNTYVKYEVAVYVYCRFFFVSKF